MNKHLVMALIFASTFGVTARAAATTDEELLATMKAAGMTGSIASRLAERLGRPINRKMRDLGRDLFFDSALALGNDNSCAGCHAPQNGFGDSQSIAIGVQNNGVVGPNRCGPRNQRRTPSVINTGFYPKLMWNGRFASNSADPFDGAAGFTFPPPEGGDSDQPFPFFPANDDHLYHLLVAQAQIPSTELPEMAGFNTESTTAFRESRFGGQVFSLTPTSAMLDAARMDSNPCPTTTGADQLPHPIGGFFNQPVRGVVLVRLNRMPAYIKRFKEVFPEVRQGKPISFELVGQAIAEFELSLTHANAPVDRFIRGENSAMSSQEKLGAQLFFGKAKCVTCHSVAGSSNEMFSDFEMHVIGIPQIAPQEPKFGGSTGNVEFKGPGKNEDFGLEDITGRPVDRYKFRTSPLRNVGLQPTFGHNGAWTRLEDAIRHHLDPVALAKAYDPRTAGVAADLHQMGPISPVLKRLSPQLSVPVLLSTDEFDALVAFVRNGLLDPASSPEEMCKLVPASLPSGRPVAKFQGC